MKKLLIALSGITVAGIAVLASGIVYAQTSDDPPAAADDEKADPDRDMRQTPPDPEAIKRALQEKAKRIPKGGLAAALRAAKDERSDRAQTVQNGPNLEALREDLKRAETQDAEQSPASARSAQSQTFSSVAPPAPPPPGIRAMAPSRLKRADEKEIERVRAPVLLPADPSLRDKLKVYGMENVYTATAIIDKEASFSMTGTCNRVIGGDPDIAAFRKMVSEKPRRLSGTGASYNISRNDFGTDLSFAKFGCGYVMTIECGDPAADTRCSADDYLFGLADSMILANPELAGGE